MCGSRGGLWKTTIEVEEGASWSITDCDANGLEAYPSIDGPYIGCFNLPDSYITTTTSMGVTDIGGEGCEECGCSVPLHESIPFTGWSFEGIFEEGDCNFTFFANLFPSFNGFITVEHNDNSSTPSPPTCVVKANGNQLNYTYGETAENMCLLRQDSWFWDDSCEGL